MPSRTLQTSVRYRFPGGTVETFTGPKCYLLANSYRGAIDRIKNACRSRGITFDLARVLAPTDQIEADHRRIFGPRAS